MSDSSGKRLVGQAFTVLDVKPGLDLRNVAGQLRGCATRVYNVTSAGGPDVLRVRDEYLRWAEDTERVLLGVFEHPNLSELHTDRYCNIRGIRQDTALPWDLLSAEVHLQGARLVGIAKALESLADRFAGSRATIAVPDTNVFLHFRLFNEIPWKEVLGTDQVRIVVPIVVVHELDRQKNTRENRLRRRAQKVLARLESQLANPAQATEIADGITIELLLDSDLGLAESTFGDSRILDVCKTLASVAERDVKLVTGDVAMRLRAASVELRAVAMPEEYRLTPDAAENEDV